MPQEPKRPVSELKPAELRTIVGEVQKLLWQVELVDDEQRSKGGCSHFWDSDKEWDCADIVSAIVTVLEDHGLKPIDPPVVIGTTHRLDYEDEPIPDDYGDSEYPDDWIGGDDASR